MKDVRLIKEKNDDSSEKPSHPYKDFAFVEFFSVQDATMVLEQAKYERMKIKGSTIFLSYSKFKRNE